MMTLAQRLRAAHVKRWQIVRVLRDQSVAEHSYLVALLATEIASTIGHTMTDSEELALLRWALYHDEIEIITGDLNTVIKKFINGRHPGSIDDIERAICSRYSKLKESTPALLRDIVKLADLLEAASFVGVEGVGVHAMEVHRGVVEGINAHIYYCKEAYPMLQWQDLSTMISNITGETK